MATAQEIAALLQSNAPAALEPNRASNLAAWLGAAAPEVPQTTPRAGIPGLTEAQAFLDQGGLAGLMGQEPVNVKLARIMRGEGTADDYESVLGGFVGTTTSAKGMGKALSMSKAARMARAQEQGFLPETVYHGTKGDISAFDPQALGAATGSPSARMGYFFAGKPETAASYTELAKNRAMSGSAAKRFAAAKAAHGPHKKAHADLVMEVRGQLFRGEITQKEAIQKLALESERGRATAREYNLANEEFQKALAAADKEGAVIYPSKIRMKNPRIYDFKGARKRLDSYAKIIDEAKRTGHDGVILKNTYDSGPKDNIYIVFEPNQIRSIFAKFDPRNIKSSDLLAGTAAIPIADELRDR